MVPITLAHQGETVLLSGISPSTTQCSALPLTTPSIQAPLPAVTARSVVKNEHPIDTVSEHSQSWVTPRSVLTCVRPRSDPSEKWENSPFAY